MDGGLGLFDRPASCVPKRVEKDDVFLEHLRNLALTTVGLFVIGSSGRPVLEALFEADPLGLQSDVSLYQAEKKLVRLVHLPSDLALLLEEGETALLTQIRAQMLADHAYEKQRLADESAAKQLPQQPMQQQQPALPTAAVSAPPEASADLAAGRQCVVM